MNVGARSTGPGGQYCPREKVLLTGRGNGIRRENTKKYSHGIDLNKANGNG